MVAVDEVLSVDVEVCEVLVELDVLEVVTVCVAVVELEGLELVTV